MRKSLNRLMIKHKTKMKVLKHHSKHNPNFRMKSIKNLVTSLINSVMKIKMVIGKTKKVIKAHLVTIKNIIRSLSADMTIIDLFNPMTKVFFNKTKRNCFMDKMSIKKRSKEDKVGIKSSHTITGHIEEVKIDKMKILNTSRMKTRKTIMTKKGSGLKTRIAASMKAKKT